MCGRGSAPASPPSAKSASPAGGRRRPTAATAARMRELRRRRRRWRRRGAGGVARTWGAFELAPGAGLPTSRGHRPYRSGARTVVPIRSGSEATPGPCSVVVPGTNAQEPAAPRTRPRGARRAARHRPRRPAAEKLVISPNKSLHEAELITAGAGSGCDSGWSAPIGAVASDPSR